MTVRRVNVWLLLVCSVFAFVVAALVADGSASAVPAIESGALFSRLRRVQKSTPTTGAPLQDTRSTSSGSNRLLKSRSAAATTTTKTAAKGASAGNGQKTVDLGESLRQRLDQTVQKVRARSKELQMEQEQKRVDRKLRRDQKKLEREQPALAASINPHNLQMPDCPAGKVYNGRRCVSSSKTPKH